MILFALEMIFFCFQTALEEFLEILFTPHFLCCLLGSAANSFTGNEKYMNAIIVRYDIV